MKVMTVNAHPYPRSGGAVITDMAFLQHLAATHGMQCCLATGGLPRRQQRRVGGVLHVTWRDLEELRQRLLDWRPDVLVASASAAEPAARLASTYGVPYVVYLHSFELCSPSDEERRRWRVSEARRYLSDTSIDRILGDAAAVFANSEFLKARHERLGHRITEVLHPAFWDVPPQRDRTGTQVVGVCGWPFKGAETFLYLADRLPQQTFTVVGGVAHDWNDRFRDRGNVCCLPFSPPRRYLRDSQVVVMPSVWPEPFGRTALEAMACGIPVLASDHGGLPEFVPEVARVPSDAPEAWEQALGALLSSPARREANARTGQAAARPFLEGRSSARLADHLRTIAGRPRYDRRPLVRIEGDDHGHTAYAMVNRAWRQALEARPRVEVVNDPWWVPTHTIHHDLQADFGEVQWPEAGVVVAVRPWDFGPYPGSWVARLSNADRLGVYSRWTARQAQASGLSRRRLVRLPLGVDPTVFHPQGARPTGTCRFLFVGASVYRKGVDILLRAWRQAFRPEDDVCLVIKDNRDDVFYQGVTADLQGLVQVEHRREFLSEADLVDLYRTCQFSVFPYRAEGFALPILETMACGLPALVPHFGACLDYCDEATSLLVPARRMAVPVSRAFAINTLGFQAEVGAVDFCEVSVDALAQALRRAHAMSEAERQALAQAGVARAQAGWTWSQAAEHVEKVLLDTAGEVPRRLREQRRESARRSRQLQTALALFTEARHAD
jgi:glycosyltransferase involved in cell wall biosynthesis